MYTLYMAKYDASNMRPKSDRSLSLEEACPGRPDQPDPSSGETVQVQKEACICFVFWRRE